MAPWVRETEGVVIRKIDIVDWESAAARQMMDTYGVEGIPFTLVVGRQGERLGEVHGAAASEVRALVTQGLGR